MAEILELDKSGETCMSCGGKNLDTGWECNDCGYDNIDWYYPEHKYTTVDDDGNIIKVK